MKQLLRDVIDTFPHNKHVPKVGTTWDRWFATDVASEIKKAVVYEHCFEIIATAGKGNRAEIPWIGIRRLDCTRSFLSGIYVALLFRRDRAGVLLSLMQGVGTSKIVETRRACVDRGRYLRTILPIPERLASFEVALGGVYSRPRSYDFGHVCGRWYDRNDLPNDPRLILDLHLMLNMYMEMDAALIMEAPV